MCTSIIHTRKLECVRELSIQDTEDKKPPENKHLERFNRVIKYCIVCIMIGESENERGSVGEGTEEEEAAVLNDSNDR
jgi:hypothetical protein